MGDATHIYTTDGTLVARYAYDAWGNHRIYDINGNEVTKGISDHIGNINPIRYRGYYYDSETELYYLEARYYDPDTGRFISQDDISYLVPNALTGINLYTYCRNNPIMYTDATGHEVVLATIVALAAIGAGIGLISGAITSGLTYTMTAEEFTWRDFGAAVAGGVVSGLISGAVSGACSVLGPVGVVVGGDIGGAIGGFAGSVTEKAINGSLFDEGSGWDILSDTLWGAAGGALGGLVSGAGGTSAGAILAKFLKHPIKNLLADLSETLLMDFTNWYSQFVTEEVIDSCA